MATPFESAQLNLKLYELRQDPVLREARTWFLRDFTPASLAELAAIVSGEHNGSFRLVLGYWDMAASLVTTGAIDRHAFLAANGEALTTFGKILPFLDDLRAATHEPLFCLHLEQVLTADPDTRETMLRRRERTLSIARLRERNGHAEM